MICDLGLCKPVEYFHSSLKNDNIYGVLPFVAPEVLRGNPYTLASDIYSFSIIMWEFTSGIPPFNDEAHDFHLSLNICKSKRPEIIEYTPQYYIELMQKCWDENPSRRPNSSEIINIIKDWIENICDKEIINENLNENLENKICNCIKQFYNADKSLKQNPTNDLIIKSHPQACHTSQLLSFTKQLNRILNQEENIKTKYFGMINF